jgi:hypothetical protein
MSKPSCAILRAGTQPDEPMPNRLVTATCLAMLAASPALACYADYRAKMDSPLRLHYGVIDLPDDACTPATATPVITERLAASGWELLQLIAIFDETGLEERKTDAGEHFLRY